ncbi:hypothetical protein KJ599_08875 [bacterium]|nr:hypothetical protein [bacterium]MBU4350418.1 hypothetical protein [bacterium]
MKNNYIKRKLMKREEYYKFGEYAPFFEEGFSDLHTLITAKKKRIVLLSDAGHGKSTELKTITNKLIKEENQDFIPILIELDTYVDGEMIDYVKNKIGDESQSLLDYDKSKLIFLFDEFDQVFNKGKAARRIRNFMEKFNKSTFIIACRTNFYSDQFGDFDIFVLLPFNSADIKKYSRKLLGNKSSVFINQLEEYNYFDLGRNPFFLNHLIEIFKKDKNIPEIPSEIFPRIIFLALENDKKRLANKYDLSPTYPTSEVEKDLMNLSLIMETLQRNFLAIDEFNKIFSDQNKRAIIPELSLIKKSFLKEGDVYQFQHNNFQEYLAAKVLSNQKLNLILEFISFRSVIKREISLIEKLMMPLEYVDFKPFGIKIDRLISKLFSLIRYKRIDKINPSWANTVAFLCQLREKDDLLEYLIKNEPELTLKFELNRIDEEKRKNLFKTIFEKYSDRGIVIDRNIDYEEMAKFGKTREIYDYLIEYATAKKENFVSRYNAIEMLRRMKGLEDESLRHLLIEFAKDENENQNVRYISFHALSWLGMASSDTIDALKHLKDSNNNRVLSGLYYLIKESAHTDQYVDILLTGIHKTRSRSSSKKFPLVDISWDLMRGIEKIQSVEGIKKTIRHFIDNPEDLREFNIERLMEKIVNNAINAYEDDNSIYNEVTKLTKIASKERIDKAISKIQLFFQKTGTAFNFFKEVYKEGMEKNYRLLASIADEQCVDFLIKQYLEGNIKDTNIWGFINFLSFKNRDSFDNLLNIINKKTNNKFLPPPARDYEKEEKEKIKRKIEIIFDKSEFLKEVEKIFNGEGKEEISFEYIENLLIESYDKDKYNDFVMRELSYYLEKNKDVKWKLDKLKNKIEQSDYEWFTIERVFNLLYHGSELELSKERIAVIKDYCLKNLKKVDFRDALKPTDKGAATSEFATMLWYFLRKFNFVYPEEVLLDMLSFDWLEGNQFVGIDYLESKLPPEKIKERILDNLNKGIKVGEVLKNHINYCKKYNLIETRDQLFNIINNPEIKIENRLLALETVADFPDSTTFLEEILDIDEFELFIKNAEILITRGNNKSKEKLLLKLSSENEKFALESAKILIKEQDLSAIQYYSDYIKRTKNFEVDFHDRNPLQETKTIKALPILIELLKFSYKHKKEIQQSEFSRLDNTIISIIKNIALQNISNRDRVVKALQKFKQKYRVQFGDLNFLNAVCDDIKKAFLINYTSQITVDEAIEKIERNTGFYK